MGVNAVRGGDFPGKSDTSNYLHRTHSLTHKVSVRAITRGRRPTHSPGPRQLLPLVLEYKGVIAKDKY
ncbi:hypothetical protein E2C01_095027 [Portunus trituberculatus]|uniref:Uncharacterized protein n=1 Tax=Portunus trituberculatus TaxID=210409 RepID=A0A5B7JNR7_PORTR|nr:hypothetical protein [Portunus trituberculatus]